MSYRHLNDRKAPLPCHRGKKGEADGKSPCVEVKQHCSKSKRPIATTRKILWNRSQQRLTRWSACTGNGIHRSLSKTISRRITLCRARQSIARRLRGQGAYYTTSTTLLPNLIPSTEHQVITFCGGGRSPTTDSLRETNLSPGPPVASASEKHYPRQVIPDGESLGAWEGL